MKPYLFTAFLLLCSQAYAQDASAPVNYCNEALAAAKEENTRLALENKMLRLTIRMRSDERAKQAAERKQRKQAAP